MRNNQRRSRARRKAYIAELEAKLRECEIGRGQDLTTEELSRASQEIQSLKRMLYSLGLDEAFLEAFSRAQRLAARFSRNPERITHISSTPEASSQHTKDFSMSEVGSHIANVIII